MSCDNDQIRRKGAVVNGGFQLGVGRQVRISAVAAVLLALWAVVHVLAAVPELHHAVHADDASSDHQCPITEFAGGAFEPTAHQPPLTACPERVYVQLALHSEVGESVAFSLPQAPRPPPSLFQLFSQTGS